MGPNDEDEDRNPDQHWEDTPPEELESELEAEFQAEALSDLEEYAEMGNIIERDPE